MHIGQEQSTVFTRRELMERRAQPIDAVIATAGAVPAWTQWAPYLGMGVVGLIIWSILGR